MIHLLINLLQQNRGKKVGTKRVKGKKVQPGIIANKENELHNLV